MLRPASKKQTRLKQHLRVLRNTTVCVSGATARVGAASERTGCADGGAWIRGGQGDDRYIHRHRRGRAPDGREDASSSSSSPARRSAPAGGNGLLRVFQEIMTKAKNDTSGVHLEVNQR